jgi:hypothetical protein
VSQEGGEEKWSARRSVHRGCDDDTADDIEVDPQPAALAAASPTLLLSPL